MLKMLLVDPSPYTTNYGLRSLSAYLWEHGVEAKMVFLNPDRGSDPQTGRYTDAVLEDLAALAEDCDVIGFSVFTNFYFRAAELTEFMKKRFPEKPVVWGGIHATVSPASSIKYADVVCLGEGEETALQLLQEVSQKNLEPRIPGTWVKTKDGVMKNEPRQLEENLDSYPYQDYEPSHMYAIKDGRIVQATESMLAEMLKLPPAARVYFKLDAQENWQYLTLTSRGCPYLCAYCCNNAYRKIYAGKGRWLRTRSVEHVIGELEDFKRKHGYVNFISFFDDDFLARPNEFISQFFDAYDERVHLAFKCNVGAFNVNREKFKRMCDSGLANVEIGLQSGSERVHKQVYFRPFLPAKFLEVARIMAEFPRVTKYYDVILDNPYETEEDLAKTIEFLAQIPKPFHLSCFSLTFFPGTALYDRAVADGLIDPENLKPISDKKNNALYLNDAYGKILVLAAGKADPKLAPLFAAAGNPFFLKAFSTPLFQPVFKKILGIALKR